MGEDEEKRSLEEGWILLIKSYMTSEIVSRVIKCVDFIQPERLLVKGIKPQGETNNKTKDKNEEFLLFHIFHEEKTFSKRDRCARSNYCSMGKSIPFPPGDLGSRRKRYMDASLGNLLKLQKVPSKYPLKTQVEHSFISLTAGSPTIIHNRPPSATDRP